MLREFREIYRNKTMIISYIITTVVTLGIYWFTSKAFAPSIQSGLASGDQSYFSYILVGDLAFLIPSLMFVGVADAIRRNAVNKTLEPMLVSTYDSRKLLMLQLFALLPIELFKAMLTFVIAVLLFDFNLPTISVFKVSFIQFASLPLFMGLGLIGGAILLRFSRGDGILGQLSSFGMILAGAYFPITVLPESLKVIGELFSPFNLLLSGTRQAIYPNEEFVFLKLILMLAIWGIFLFSLGYFLVGHSLKYNRKKGAPFLFSR